MKKLSIFYGISALIGTFVVGMLTYQLIEFDNSHEDLQWILIVLVFVNFFVSVLHSVSKDNL
jgi:hypothetical protein